MNRKQIAGIGAAAIAIASLTVVGGVSKRDGKDQAAYVLEQHFARDNVTVVETGITDSYQTRIVPKRNGAYASVIRESINGVDRKVEAAQTRRELFRAGKIEKATSRARIVEATGAEAAALRARPEKTKKNKGQ